MVETFGLSIPEDLLDAVEEDLEYGDSRSERVCDLVETGLIVEELAAEYDMDVPEHPRDRRAFIRQLFLAYEKDLV